MLNFFSKVTAAEVRDKAVDEMERLREAAEKKKKEDADAEKLKQANRVALQATTEKKKCKSYAKVPSSVK